MNGVGSLPEPLLHRSPIAFVQLGLKLWLQTHEDEVADEVGLAQLKARRVHTLEDQLWVVLRAVERDINNDQFGETLADRLQFILVLPDQLLEQSVVLVYPSAALGRHRRSLENRQQGFFVGF